MSDEQITAAAESLEGTPESNTNESSDELPSEEVSEEVCQDSSVEDTENSVDESPESITADSEESSEQESSPETDEESADESDEEINSESADGESDDEQNKDNKKKKLSVKSVLRISLMTLSIILAVILLALAGLLGYGALPHKTEIGEKVKLPLKDSPLLSSVCHVKTNLDGIDTSTLGKHPLELEFFGFIKINSTLVVHDSTPPSITAHNLYIPRGTNVLPEEFISKAVDLTELTYSFANKIDTEKGGKVTVRATDECKNKSTRTVKLSVSDLLSDHVIELGTFKTTFLYKLQKNEWLSDIDLSTVNFFECGTYRVTGKLNGENCIFSVTVADTTAPTAKALSRDILLGQPIEAETLVENVKDRSDVITYFESEPNFDTLGIQDVSIILEDEYGNDTKLNAKVNIHNISPAFVIEAGTPTDVFENELFANIDEDDLLPCIADDLSTEQLPVGAHEIQLVGKYSTIPIEITVKDTVPPTLSVEQTTVYTGTTPDAADFIVDCVDASDVEFTFAEDIDTSAPGEQTVTVIATDAAGNSTSASTTMYIINDTARPVIYGVKPLTALEGETVSYRSGVYALDDKDGKVAVTVNSSGVNTNVAGTYYITYTATDSSKNTRTVTTTVTIKAVTRQSVNELADKILATIVTDTMDSRQKARAIYAWCVANISYSSSTSNLMGHFNRAAYSGFTKHYGNCYTYYAVASALLTRAGIENIEIHRNDSNRPHYWNLVKINGAWYHFDTCPQPAPYRLTVFLLTDSQVRAFPLSYYYNFDANNYPATP